MFIFIFITARNDEIFEFVVHYTFVVSCAILKAALLLMMIQGRLPSHPVDPNAWFFAYKELIEFQNENIFKVSSYKLVQCFKMNFSISHDSAAFSQKMTLRSSLLSDKNGLKTPFQDENSWFQLESLLVFIHFQSFVKEFSLLRMSLWRNWRGFVHSSGGSTGRYYKSSSNGSGSENTCMWRHHQWMCSGRQYSLESFYTSLNLWAVPNNDQLLTIHNEGASYQSLWICDYLNFSTNIIQGRILQPSLNC